MGWIELIMWISAAYYFNDKLTSPLHYMVASLILGVRFLSLQISALNERTENIEGMIEDLWEPIKERKQMEWEFEKERRLSDIIERREKNKEQYLQEVIDRTINKQK